MELCGGPGPTVRPRYNYYNLDDICCYIIIISLLCQVTAEYQFEKGACVPIRVHTVVVSCQHSEKVTLEALRKDIMEKVINTTIPKKVIYLGFLILEIF